MPVRTGEGTQPFPFSFVQSWVIVASSDMDVAIVRSVEVENTTTDASEPLLTAEETSNRKLHLPALSDPTGQECR